MAIGGMQGSGATAQGTIVSDILDNDTLTPTTVLDGAKKFKVRASWSVNAPLAGIINAQHSWIVQVFADELGGQFDELIGTLSVPGVPNQTTYPAVDVECKALVDAPPAGKSGLYRIATTVTLFNSGQPSATSGFVDNGMIQTV